MTVLVPGVSRLEVIGSNVRNSTVVAAFLTADDRQAVAMRHLLHATKREYEKMGQVVMEGEFGQQASPAS
jgi:hypothetical protein